MIERPEYKRRWATEGWDALQEKALRSWLLDRMENRDHWFDENGQPHILTLARLTDALSRAAEVHLGRRSTCPRSGSSPMGRPTPPPPSCTGGPTGTSGRQALATYFTNTALSTEEITPFLAGYRQYKQGEHGLTDDDLRNWQPPAATRGRRAAVKK